MKGLLDTNIIIHREASRVVRKDIGVLFRWLDRLHYEKYIHPATVREINKYNEKRTRETLNIKLDSYNVLQVQSALHPDVQAVASPIDTTPNDQNDTLLLNELYNERVDLLITEDKKIRHKASLLGISDRVFTIEAFLEKVTAENPGLTDYKVLAVKKERCGNINVKDEFFDSFREDYPGFDSWFNRKSEEEAYVCTSERGITAFLYLKVEDENEPYPDISPTLTPKKRLKIGTFKVTLNGYRLGERFLKIVFDNAIRLRVAEVYVTIFDRTAEQQRLIELLEEFGFRKHGVKHSTKGDELVYVRSMGLVADREHPKFTFPFFSKSSRAFLCPIYPQYHTSLLPDSILRTESPADFIEQEPHRNAISKVYICRSIRRDLRFGDVIIFYRTATDRTRAYHTSVITTIGIVESTIQNIPNVAQFIRLCRKRSVFTDEELVEQWNFNPNSRPFIVNFLYAYSFPRRINRAKLIEIGILDQNSAPRGFELITPQQFADILKETQSDDYIAVD